ncbi:uncharacterized protein M6B38_395565 [Iris pallida]|uniref:Uncharacterized protein n=1 Tax=Iris pallida TaxID=29817 RepID=A0AAX6FX90_IRIPA|nr:uncharacterized protein M6B38_395565 [Iris pallida]
MAVELSPRVSLSHEHLSSSPTFTSSSYDTLPVDPPSPEFDFSTSYEASSSSTPADLLFSQGKLLPLYGTTTRWTPQLPKPKPSNNNNTSSCNKQPSIGRSSSVSCSSKTASVCQFPRSKSTGCSLNPTKSPGQSWSSSAKAGAYYYCGDRRVTSYGNGVRINPVINVPAASFIPRGGSSGSSSSGSGTTSSAGAGGRSRSSFFAYLLCNCTGKNMEMNQM